MQAVTLAGRAESTADVAMSGIDCEKDDFSLDELLSFSSCCCRHQRIHLSQESIYFYRDLRSQAIFKLTSSSLINNDFDYPR